jgi:tight adherence protein B
MGSNLSLIIIFSIFIGGIILLGLGILTLIRGKNVALKRAKQIGTSQAPNSKNLRRPRSSFKDFRAEYNKALKVPRSKKMQIMLFAASWKITVIEFYFLLIIATALGFFLAWIISDYVISGLGMALIIYIIPFLLLKRGVQKRQQNFQKQLGDVLTILTGAVKVGYSFLQSLDVVIKELPPPASEEFARVRREVELGTPTTQAMINLSERMESKDFQIIVSAVNINQEVGGNLATMLESVNITIRDRIRILGEARVLTTYARYSSYILSMLPIFAAGLIFVLNPEYMVHLFDPGLTRVILLFAIAGVISGNIILRKISNIEV